jgi:hypothetical protein
MGLSQSMIRKKHALGYEPMGGNRFSLATNAERLRGITMAASSGGSSRSVRDST